MVAEVLDLVHSLTYSGSCLMIKHKIFSVSKTLLIQLNCPQSQGIHFAVFVSSCSFWKQKNKGISPVKNKERLKQAKCHA